MTSAASPSAAAFAAHAGVVPRPTQLDIAAPQPCRLVGLILTEQDDEWQDGRRYLGPETMTAITAAAALERVGPPLPRAS